MIFAMYSWILPIKNEVKSLPQLLSEIKKAMRGKNCEIIAVDDASSDSSRTLLQNISQRDKSLKLVTFTSHVGKWVALSAGLKNSRGQIIITSDADLQDDPAQINKLLGKLASGYDLVSGSREPRKDPFYKILLARTGNRLAALLKMGDFTDFSSPFKVARREVFQNIPKEGTFLRFSLIFAQKMGYKVAEVPTTHRPRLYDRSKFGPVKYLRILYDLLLITLLFSGSGHLGKIKR